ncbi:ATPase [Secundilactobacillus paracollinoides]|uniref:ATP-binding protein n=1 Tax=Secundilactobacillus paracollinoides TaxID=240427 RepID=UPI0006D14CE7|nr:ATP-binding protein [Secundilactobacillus paracollinoides]ANZ63801.1 ATPase [Secundilactobacillus paracollinoides]KRL76468.1 hypothetical protein FC17_GL001971 [Secundilactobacillus paracollinoides DSM 15502 = JCM 11969]
MLSYQQLLVAIPLVLKAGNVPTIVGEAGIGKSALVADVADQMQAKLFTTTVSLSEKGDLAIPIPPLTDKAYVQTTRYGELADVKFGYTHTLIEIIHAAEAESNRPIIWFLDEFNRGTQAVQSELMNLVLQRQINTLKLPAQVHLILAENPDATMAGFEQSDYGVVTGDAAINDRTVRLVMRADTADWLAWARQDNGHGQPRIQPTVTRFIEENPNQLRPSDHDDDLYPTPRAWARVSANLTQLSILPADQQSALRLDVLAGDLGVTVSRAFEQYLRRDEQGLTAAEIYADAEETPELSATVLDRFDRFNPGQQQSILADLVDQNPTYPLNTPQVAGRFLTLLQHLAPDGQYAIALKIAETPEILEGLAAHAEQKPDAVADLYQALAQIGVASDAQN